MTERHTCKGRQEIVADPLTHHLLNENPHLLVIVEQTALLAVFNGVGSENRSVDLSNGIHNRG